MLLDTSGLYNHLDNDEPYHQEARRLFRKPGRKVTHSYVLSELVALAQTRGAARHLTLDFMRYILGRPEITVVWVDAQLHSDALSLLEARRDKEYSLADAVSFVLMREFEFWDALTSDHHFEQEGFLCLLQPDRK